MQARLQEVAIMVSVDLLLESLEGLGRSPPQKGRNWVKVTRVTEQLEFHKNMC